MEKREAYLATQSDFHMHVHDLPPQIGGATASGGNAADIFSVLVIGASYATLLFFIMHATYVSIMSNFRQAGEFVPRRGSLLDEGHVCNGSQQALPVVGG